MTSELPSAPIPLPVYEAIVEVCGQTLYWKSQLRRVFRRAGVAERALDRYEPLSKYQIARAVLDDLERAGKRGWLVQRRIAQELASLEGPDPKAPDQQAGHRALDRLRRIATDERILVDPAEAERTRRRQEAADESAQMSRRREELAALRGRFVGLHSESDRQRRGYALEALLRDLFALYELEYSGSYKTETDQVDGAVVLDSFTYLLEARWRANKASDADIGGLKHRVERRLDATRGFFISMAGFREEAVALYRLAQENKLIFIDGQDLMCILDDRPSLLDALHEKVRAASTHGEPYLRLGEL